MRQTAAESWGCSPRAGEQSGDMRVGGIVDPGKVVRVALQGAESGVRLMITIEARAGKWPKPDASATPGGMDYGSPDRATGVAKRPPVGSHALQIRGDGAFRPFDIS